MRYRFIDAEKANYPVTVLCRVLRVAKSGFYAWLGRVPSSRAEAAQRLRGEIQEVFEQSRGTYGSPRVHAELVERGHAVSRARIERDMRTMGLVARPPKKFRVTTDSAHDKPIAENILDRHFDTTAPNQAWTTDITYVWTREGWIYLAIVLDLISRRVVGWSIANHMRTGLILEALDRALGRRLPGAGLIHHSDRGVQPGFNRSSQQRLSVRSVALPRVPRREYASRGSYGASC